MTYCLKVLAGDPDAACTMLLDWSKEMQMLDTFLEIKKYGFNPRSRLAHHLTTIGMDNVAYK